MIRRRFERTSIVSGKVEGEFIAPIYKVVQNATPTCFEETSYYDAKLEATNNLIKLIKRNAFGFRNFENFKKRIFIALNIKKERTKCVLSRF